MNKLRIQIFTKALFILFIIATAILFFLMYKDIDNKFANRFAIGYLILCLFFLIYIPAITLMNLRKMKRVEVKSKVLKFIVLLAFFTIVNYGLAYVFWPSRLDLLNAFVNATGVAFAGVFIDVIFLGKNS